MTSELERLTRLVKAYEWTLAIKKAETAAAELKSRQKAVEGCRRDIERCTKELQGMEKDVDDIQKKRDKVSDAVLRGSSAINAMTGAGNDQRRQDPSVGEHRE